MKKTLSIILALALAITVLVVPASASYYSDHYTDAKFSDYLVADHDSTGTCQVTWKMYGYTDMETVVSNSIKFPIGTIIHLKSSQNEMSVGTIDSTLNYGEEAILMFATSQFVVESDHATYKIDVRTPSGTYTIYVTGDKALESDNMTEEKVQELQIESSNAEGLGEYLTDLYDDVKVGDWYYEAVWNCDMMNLMDPITDTTFNPNQYMTRADTWELLARLESAYETQDKSVWNGDAKAYVMASGVSDGTNPNGNLTREQFMTMLYRWALNHGKSGVLVWGEFKSIYRGSDWTNESPIELINTREGYIKYMDDYDEISDWAKEAVDFAFTNYIINGTSDTTISPKGLVTRAQAAAMAAAFREYVVVEPKVSTLI